MTLAALWNYQHSVKENKSNIHTDYAASNELERYVIAHTEARNKAKKLIIDRENYNKVIEAAGKEIANAAAKELKKIFNWAA